MRSYTLSTVSSVGDLTSTTAAAELVLLDGDGNDPSGSSGLSSQIASIFVTSASTNATPATIVLFLLDEVTNTRLFAMEFTVTATAYRTPVAGGASGGYICTVANADSTNKIDLNGHCQNIATTTAVANTSAKTRWYVACTVNANLGTLTVYVADTRCI